MIPLIMAAAGAAVSAGGALSKAISGAQRARKMQDAIANYQRQELTNQVRGQIGVSTLGADLQREEMARSTATSVDALASGGVRGMVGGIGRIQQANNYAQREIGADLDRQQQQIDQMAIQDDQRIRDMQERREEQDLAGMGAELNAARQDQYSGIGDIGQSLMSVGLTADAMGYGKDGVRPQTTGVNSFTSAPAVMGPRIAPSGWMAPGGYVNTLRPGGMISPLAAPLMPNNRRV